jgi:glycosyltransferase involved in cell wall biosynthesis
MSKVSVIIPNYNCSQWLTKVIESCLIQEHLKEIIVTDDQSTDKSWEILTQLQNQFPEKIKIYKNPEKGGNNARNYGFSKSSGEYIQWLDADDYLLPGKFENQLKTFENNQNAEIVYSDWHRDIYAENGTITKREEIKKADYKDFTFEILSDNWSVPANYLIKRTLAEKLHQQNAWNPETRVAQDREYFTLAVLSGAKAAYCPGFYCVYNVWNKNSVSAMDFKTRLAYQLKLEKRFRNIILKNNYPNKLKRQYLSLLNAHVMNACFYNPKLTIPYPFSILNLKWDIIHWKKWPFIPWIYAWQHFKYLSHDKKDS